MTLQYKKQKSSWLVWALVPVAFLVALPVLAVLFAALQWDAASADIVWQMAQTVLPTYIGSTLLLCLMVAIGSTALGLGAALMVTLCDFKGRASWEWLLLLPLAMPAYVSAYAYTDFLQYGGPAQEWLRLTFNLEGRVLPEVRSLWGAALMFTLTLYPYVYLLARAALLERAAHLIEAARLLGASLPRRLWRVALPLTRPAVAAGMALALMETLADFGVSSYFGIQTFTAGIYKAWLVMDDRMAAVQLATVLLASVGILLWLERRAQSRMRFAPNSSARSNSLEARPLQLQGWRAGLLNALCALPVLLGFVLPVAMMLRPFLQGLESDQPVPWAQFGHWALNSVQLAGLAAVLAVALALALASIARLRPGRLVQWLLQITGLGYAVPGAVIVVGLLIPLGALQMWQPEWGVAAWVTTTIVGIVWAYLVRFTAVALQSVQSGYARIPQSHDDAARTLGTHGLRLFKTVHLPLLRRPVLVAVLLVFVDIMKELPATLVLRPFNYDTLAVVAYQLARDERLSEAALPSLALVLVGLIPVILISRSLRSEQA